VADGSDDAHDEDCGAWAVAYLEGTNGRARSAGAGMYLDGRVMEGRGVGVRTAEAIIAEARENGVCPSVESECGGEVLRERGHGVAMWTSTVGFYRVVEICINDKSKKLRH
jgi:hypothetical protein